jgi:phage minor structural protein
VIGLKHDEVIFSTETFTFSLPADDPKASLIAEDRMVRWGDRRFTVSKVRTRHVEAELVIEVECDALWYRLGDRKRVGSTVITAQTRAVGLAAILEGTGWTVGARTDLGAGASTAYTFEAQDATVLSLIRDWAKITGTYPFFDTVALTVDLVPSYGVARGTGFRYARNLVEIEREARPPTVTRLYPYGKDGLPVSGVNGGAEYIEDFTFYTDQGLSLAEARALYTRDEVWSDSTFIEELPLLAAAQQRLAERAGGRVEYRMKVLDLTELEGVREHIQVGDTVRVADTLLGVNVRTYVTRLVQYPLEPWRNEIELSTAAPVPLSGSSNTRPNTTLQWDLFNSDTATDYLLRNDATWITNRIPLAFGADGEAIYGCTVTAVGVGTGSLSVSALDAESNTLLHPVQTVPYTDGETVTSTITFAFQDLNAQYDYRIRMQAVNSGGPSASAGVDIASLASRFWILARGATRRTPVTTNSQTFRYVSNAAQQFTVPDGITEVTIEAAGGTGGVDSVFSAQANGCIVTATFQVVPGAVYDVYVPDKGGVDTTAGRWPDGGNGDAFPSTAFEGMGGGGSARVIPSGGALAAAIVVAPAGGGQSEGHPADAMRGGDGGFFTGDPGLGVAGGGGATQYAGGAAGVGSTDNGDPGVFGDGGDAGDVTFHGNCPGGGGGGYYGGGGGGVDSAGFGQKGGGGGGGSGFIAADGYDLQAQDGGNTPSSPFGGEGYVTFSWDAPD